MVRGRKIRKGEIGSRHPVECPLCKRYFLLFNSLGKHIKTRHKDLLNLVLSSKDHNFQSLADSFSFISSKIKARDTQGWPFSEFESTPIDGDNCSDLKCSATEAPSFQGSNNAACASSFTDPASTSSSLSDGGVSDEDFCDNAAGSLPPQSKKPCKTRSSSINGVDKRHSTSKKTGIMQNHSTSDVTSEFYVLYDAKNDDSLYFCNVCRRYGNKLYGKLFSGGYDYIYKGVSFKTFPWRKNHYLHRHLKSLQHKESLGKMAHDDYPKIRKGFPLDDYPKVMKDLPTNDKESVQRQNLFQKKPNDSQQNTYKDFSTNDEGKTAVENVCQAVQCIIEVSQRYEEMAALVNPLLQLLLPDCPSPLEDHYPKSKNFLDFFHANYIASLKEMKEKFNAFNINTNQTRRHCIAGGRATAPYDATRQMVITTYIGDDGKVQEGLIGCKRIFDNSYQGYLDHFFSSLDGLINPKTIIADCTDGEIVYAGSPNGTRRRSFKNSTNDSKITHLPDVYHLAGILLEKTLPEWLKNIFETTNQIARDLASGSRLGQFSCEMGSNDLHFMPIDAMLNTLDVRYTAQHLDSVLRNVPFLLKHLPHILGDLKYVHYHEKCLYIYNFVKAPENVCKILLAHAVFSAVSSFGKAAQAQNYDLFDMVKGVKKLHKDIKHFQTNLPLNYLEFLRTGEFSYQVSSFSQSFCVETQYTLQEMNSYIISVEFDEWVSCILEDFNNYLEIPELILNITKFFRPDIEDVEKRRLFFYIFNNMSLNFQSCGNKCEGISECVCISKEIGVFTTHFSEKLKTDTDHKSLFAFYLTDPSVCNLKVTNIVRIIEATLIFKPTRSSIERANAIVANTVEGRFENQYVQPDSGPDMVEFIVFQKFNSSRAKIGVASASEELLKVASKEKLLKTKPTSISNKSAVTDLKKSRKEKLQSKRKSSNTLDIPKKKKNKRTPLSQSNMDKLLVKVEVHESSLFKKACSTIDENIGPESIASFELTNKTVFSSSRKSIPPITKEFILPTAQEIVTSPAKESVVFYAKKDRSRHSNPSVDEQM